MEVVPEVGHQGEALADLREVAPEVAHEVAQELAHEAVIAES
jgi:hypothetical protein